MYFARACTEDIRYRFKIRYGSRRNYEAMHRATTRVCRRAFGFFLLRAEQTRRQIGAISIV